MNKFLIFFGILVIAYFVITGVYGPSKKLEAAEVISNCWDEELKICKDEEKGDACTFGVYKLCGEKHPEMQIIFEKNLHNCEYSNPGSAIDNPNILECSGVDSDRNG